VTKDQLRTSAAVFGMFLGTPVAMVLGFARWVHFQHPWMLWDNVREWPWFRCSILLSLLTFLWAMLGLMPSTEQEQRNSAWPFIAPYVSVVLPITAIALSPLPDTFTASLESPLLFFLCLALVHGRACFVLRLTFGRAINREFAKPY
jgi:cytochrome bd-type quinol oxidase subunit 2